MRLNMRLALTAMLLLLGSLAAMAQTVEVKGVAKDKEGKPLVGATVQIKSTENGRVYQMKVGKDGTFTNISVLTGIYDVTLIQNGQTIWTTNFRAQLQAGIGQSENQLNFINLDLSKLQDQSQQTMSAEQKAQYEKVKAENAKAEQENVKIKGLNQMLAQAKTAADQQDYGQAVNIMKQATQADPNRDLLWGNLALYLVQDGVKQEKAGQRDQAMQEYQQAEEPAKKAIELAKADPKSAIRVGPWENTLAQSLLKQRKFDEAVQHYDAAANEDPKNAAMYHYNAGVAMINSGKTEQANSELDKAIAADPNYAEAYYQKAVNNMQKATLDSAGKMKAPEGTTEALNKYLELKPDGPNAQGAKDLLAAMGETVSTSYGKGKTKKK